MATQQIPNLVQGVSQQAAQQRRDTQCESQFDCFNSVTNGAGARPPFEVLKVWPSRDLSGAFFAEMERAGENYLTGIYDEAAFAINLLTGVDGTITGNADPNTTGYLNAVVGVDPKDQFRAQVVEDNIFIVNRHIRPAMDASVVTGGVVNEALVWMRGTGIGTTRVDLTGPATINASTNSTSSGTIISDLATAIHGVNGYSAEVVGSSMRIWRADLADFNISVRDGLGDTLISAYKGYVPGLELLPPRAFEGMRLEVRGESRTEVDNYWVEFIGSTSIGAWREIPGVSTETTIEPDTMPHALVLTGVNTFEWNVQAWSTRIAGDADTAPNPGFIGELPRDLFYHKRRLGLLYEGGAVWSKAKYPFTFFPDTLQTVLANAPVDVTLAAASSDVGSVTLDFAVQVDKTLQFWGQQAQFEVSSGQETFKQETISADPSTAYEYARGADPLPLGSFLFYASEAGGYAALSAVLYQQGKASTPIDVSAQITNFITSGIIKLTGSDTFRTICALSEGDPDVLYLWNYLFSGGEYLQSSWNQWRVPGGDILWVGIRSNYIRIIQQRPEGVALLRANLTPKVVDDITGALYLTRLDMRVTQAQVTGLSYNGGTGITTFTLPYTPTGPDMKVVLAETSGSLNRGREYPVVDVTGAVVQVTGDLSGGKKFYAGQVITAERTESRFYVRNEKGVLPSDRMTVNRFGLEVSDTGYTRLEVTKPNGDIKSEEFASRTAGISPSPVGTPVLGTGKVEIPVAAKAGQYTLRMVNDSWLPSYWQAADYDYTGVGKSFERGE